MFEWISHNKEWLFSGIGGAFLTAIIGIAKSKSGFKLTFNFYALLFIAFVVWIGLDYFLNFSGDFRLRIFLFGIAVIGTFILDRCFVHFKQYKNTRKAVNNLTLQDCQYVLQCHNGTECIEIDFTNYPEFQTKWAYILYVPTGSKIALHEPYRIYVYEQAYKLVRKKLKGAQK